MHEIATRLWQTDHVPRDEIEYRESGTTNQVEFSTLFHSVSRMCRPSFCVAEYFGRDRNPENFRPIQEAADGLRTPHVYQSAVTSASTSQRPVSGPDNG